MIERCRWLLAVILCGLLVFLCGCAAGKNQNPTADNYKKLIALQKKKAEAIQAQEPSLPENYQPTADYYEQLGDFHMRQEDLLSAFTAYQNSLEKEPKRLSARAKIGLIYLERGLHQDAIAEFEGVLAQDKQNALAYLGRGKAWFLQKNPDKAKEDLSRALEINDKLWQAHALLGVILDTEKNFAAAQEEYLKAVVLQPDAAEIYNNLGVSYYLDGKFDKAADAFLSAFGIAPENKRICNNLALALYRVGNVTESLEAFKRGSGEAAAYNNIGYLQLKDKQYEKAMAALEKAIEANPSYYARAKKNMEKVKAALNRVDQQETISNQDSLN